MTHVPIKFRKIGSDCGSKHTGQQKQFQYFFQAIQMHQNIMRELYMLNKIRPIT